MDNNRADLEFIWRRAGMLAVILSAAIAVTRCSQQAPSRAHFETYTAANEQQLQAGVDRLQQLKRELLLQHFYVVSASSSNEADVFDLGGQFGNLTGLRITLRIGKQLQSKEPQLGAGLFAFLGSPKAEQDFNELDARLRAVVMGRNR